MLPRIPGDDPAASPAARQIEDQTAKQQQPPPAEQGDAVSSVVEGVVDAVDVVGTILSIFE